MQRTHLPVLPPPKPRIPERRQVTVAIGLMADDGLVIAADSEQTGGDFLKTPGAKVFASSVEPVDGGPVKAFAVTGSGDVGYLGSVTQSLTRAFQNNNDAPEDVLEPIFADVVLGFYRKHVLPFGIYPANERPDVSLVFGTTRDYGCSLWQSQRSAIRSVQDYAAVGVGGMFATGLLARLWWRTDVRTMALLAAYVICQAKECVPYCGKWTQLFILRPGKKPTYLPLQYAEQLDVAFQRYIAAERILFRYLAGATTPRSEWKDVSRVMRSVRSEIQRFAEHLPLEFAEPE
jgi:20S proteasome alpha/beta subunit